MPYRVFGHFILLFLLILSVGCTAWQPTKEVWKTTKGLWYTYVSPPAQVDYDDKGSSRPEAVSLSQALMPVDMELGKLERVMQNADRPPTQVWLNNLFASFPWLSGFAGVKYDGQILGQEPPDSMKELDFIPLLYEDQKQNSRALRADVQPSPLGPEIMLATPLYDGTDFLGIVVAYFDMRSLMRYSNNANDIVVLCPQSLLWPGKYEFAATPLAGVDWAKVVVESSSGTCTNNTGTFYYMVRYLGNLPLVFAVPSHGTFPEGSGNLDQGYQYFPQEREKLPPPPMPERKGTRQDLTPAFEKPEPEPEPEPEPAPMPQPSERNVIQQGSRDSMLLKKQQATRRRQIQERALEGENVPMPRREQPRDDRPALRLLPEGQNTQEALPGGRPSPFGPRPQESVQPPSESANPEMAPANEGAPADASSDSQRPAVPEVRGAVSPDNTPATPPPSVIPESGGAGPAEKKPEAIEKPALSQQQRSSEEAPRQADGEKAPEEGPTEEHRAPAKLPGGRPSPFGPR